jgi:hypothetical protein
MAEVSPFDARASSRQRLVTAWLSARCAGIRDHGRGAARQPLYEHTCTAANWFATEKAALRQFLESAERFNRKWQAYIDGLDLEPVNKPRRDYNQFYVLEKSCAFASEKIAEGFEPLALIDCAYLFARFPFLALPNLA